MWSIGCVSSPSGATLLRSSRRRWTSRCSGRSWPRRWGRGTARRAAFDPVLKFRMLVLQAMHGLSLAQTEYLVADRLSWMRFCGLGPGDAVPDACA